MATASLAYGRRRPIRRFVLVAAAATAALAIGMVGRAYVDHEDQAQERVVDMSASYAAIPDLAELSRRADLVVVGRVVGDGATEILKPPNAAATAGAGARVPTGSTVAKGFGTPVTTYTIEVERVVHG